MSIRLPIRYVPFGLTKKDQQSQKQMLMKSRRLYKKGKYYTRKIVPSFHSRPSKHLAVARKTYRVRSVYPSKELAKATGCSIDALERIVEKGEGAYFSSGSRPNQTGQSWGIARLASAITGGKAAAVDYNILESGCNHRKRAFQLAKQARDKYGRGTGKTHGRRI